MENNLIGTREFDATNISFELSTEDRAIISRICGNDEFLDEIEKCIQEFRILYKYQEMTEPGRTDLRKILKALQKNIDGIQENVTQMHDKFYTVLDELAGDGFFSQLSTHLGMLRGIVIRVQSQMGKHRNFAQRKMTAPLHMAGQVKSILQEYGIRPKIYIVNAWIRLIDVALKAANVYTEHAAMNLAREWQSLDSVNNRQF